MADEDDDSTAGVRRIVAICGTSRRRRRWVLAPRNLVVAAFGSVELDLREAAAAAAAAEVQIVAVCGRVTLVVPPGADVELAGFSLAGSSDCTVEEAPARPALPPIRASAVALFARVRVRSEGGHERPAKPVPAEGIPAAARSEASVVDGSRDRPVPAAAPPPPPPPPPSDGQQGPSAPPVVPPRALAVGEVLRRLLPVPVRVRRAPAPFPDGEREPAVVATYRDADGRLVAAAVTDFPAAASLAAARTGEPAASDLAPQTVAAVGEVLAEAASLFGSPTDDGGPALSADVAGPADGLPDELARLIEAPAARADLVIEVDGQPGGALTFLVAA